MKEDQLHKFIEIYKKHYSQELDRTEALRLALKVLWIIELLLKDQLISSNNIC